MRVAWKWLRPDLVKCDRGVVSTESKLAGAIDNYCARFLSIHCENLRPLI